MLIEQESPESFSVFNLAKRTNNEIEANNGVMKERIPKKGHFFRFVCALQKLEYERAFEVAVLITTGV